ncbi:NADPH-dependent F420 reductase [Streptomyces tauricus]|uniref:NADPH-dependent F420 reductase n=1 Tax=Streptomyces tauricus TaxID=68274 RepID=UPI0033A14B1F
MHIAIIGAGNVGSALAAAAAAAGHDVILSATSPQKASTVAEQVGVRAAQSNADAVSAAEVVVLAVPGSATVDVARELASALVGKVVVDATNPLNATFTDLEIEKTAAVQSVQDVLPGVPVVKAFNSVFAGRFGSPAEGDGRLDGLYAGDDSDAKKVVGELLASLGFRPVDAGGLRMARALEEMAFLNISLNAGNDWPWQSGWALLGPTA